MYLRQMYPNELDRVLRLLRAASFWSIAESSLDFGVTLVAVDFGRLVATLSVRDGNRICYVGVHPRYRGRGYARALLRHSLLYITGNPYLFVKMMNFPAICLYWSEGYRIVGTRKFSFKMRANYRYGPRLSEQRGRFEFHSQDAEYANPELYPIPRTPFPPKPPLLHSGPYNP